MTKARVTILLKLIERFGYRRYLEIGAETGRTFRQIPVTDKVAVDPAPAGPDIIPLTSDAFFASNRKTFDLVFVDGLHEAGQALRDIRHALQCLAPGGTIVVHDCSPLNKAEETVPRLPGQDLWTGNVWRAFVAISLDPTLHTVLVDVDHGCGLIRRRTGSSPGIHASTFPADRNPMNPDDVTWEEFELHKNKWLKVESSASLDAVIQAL